MKRVLALALGVGLVLLARGWLANAGSIPDGQPGLVEVHDLDGLRAAFNRESAKTRVVIVLSAACPYCLKGASSIQQVFDRHRDAPLVAFVVWQPILPADWGKPRTGPLHRLSDTRVQQFWDADHRVAGALKASFEHREQQPQCCDQNGIWWDFMAAFPPGGEWHDRFPEPALLGGTVDDVAAEFEALLVKLAQAR